LSLYGTVKDTGLRLPACKRLFASFVEVLPTSLNKRKEYPVGNGFRISEKKTLPDPPSTEASLDHALDTIRSKYPRLKPSYIKLPMSSGAKVVIYGSVTGRFFSCLIAMPTGFR